MDLNQFTEILNAIHTSTEADPDISEKLAQLKDSVFSYVAEGRAVEIEIVGRTTTEGDPAKEIVEQAIRLRVE